MKYTLGYLHLVSANTGTFDTACETRMDPTPEWWGFGGLLAGGFGKRKAQEKRCVGKVTPQKGEAKDRAPL